ncbi:MAG TPA: sigma-70 family RNA polymerase sigma factor [Thermoanaerobaculia bacterium]|nr:sigma-70 family RNA polymerase sigma factor [Thermoanaerobaculia bacterium]
MPDVLASQGSTLDVSERPEDLVARIQAGDRRAEERLVETYGRGIAILLDRQTNGRPEAEDIFQETFRLVIEKLRRGELREPAKLPGFLAQIARSLTIEHYRKIQRRKTEPDSDAVAEVEASGSGPLSELLTREDAGLVRQVIRELGTERDRDILLRFYIAEEDKERISADFGLSSLQFNRVLHRARERYRELYLERVGRRALGIILLFVTLSLGGRRAG